MSDFLSRLAGRALRQTPVLEPLVASVHAPLQVVEASAPDFEALDEDERRAPDQPALAAAQTPGRAFDRRRDPVASLAALPDGLVNDARATVPTPTSTPSGAVAVAAVAETAPRDVVVEAERADAARKPVVVKRASPKARAEQAFVDDDRAEVEAALPTHEKLVRTVGGRREQVPARDRRDVAEARAEETPLAVDERVASVDERVAPTDARGVNQRSVRRSLTAAPPRTERANGELRSDESQPTVAPRLGRAQYQPAEPPTITISIGRIEVRAAPPPPRVVEAPVQPRKTARLSLDEYLAQRSRNER